MSFILLAALAMQAAPVPAAKSPNDKKICKMFASTGSRLGGKRICKTAHEWDEEEVSARREIDTMRNNAARVTPGGG
ncbi:hypothetical protein GCM10011380_14900 [Sphingomonas metalli]|uniref:Uncharacterized protein n=1 Tax=Sphingomonas metalli TaxID=1779358 RepID=A0A916T1S4_9SPHN|nr:hypothetical protein [Sphingomonas metalli]GGB26408.1 hypothetical protein GCM10011380_14900 [Sphingomonas metalli]